MESGSAPGGPSGEPGISPLLQALAGLDPGGRRAVVQVIALYREFPAWAVWLPRQGRRWAAVRPASARHPGPDLPMIWVHAVTAAELADAQLTPP